MLRITLNQQEYLFDKKAETVMLNGHAVNADVVKLDKNKFHVIINNSSYNIELLAKDENAKNQIILVNGQKQNVEMLMPFFGFIRNKSTWLCFSL